MKVIHRIALVCCLAWTVNSCTYNDINKSFDCSTTTLAITLDSKKDATTCRSIDGQIIVSATGGTPAYDFSLGDGVYQTNPVFDRLAPGSYLLTVKDISGCKKSVQVELAAENSTLAATATSGSDTACLTDNGTITVTPSGGTSPYVAKIDNGIFGSVMNFSNLKNGNHTIIVKDNEDCERVMIVTVSRGNTGISYSGVIAPIFVANCNFNGCHGAGSTGRDWTKFDNVKARAEDIKNRTANRSMPIGGFTLSAQQIQEIACWVDDGANNN